MSLAYPLGAAEASRLLRASLLVTAAAPSPVAPLPDEEAVVVMGAFDGAHRGHRSLVRAALADARARGVPCLALTFDPDPSELIDPASAQPRLLCVADRVRALRALGAQGTIVLPFDEGLARLSPRAFVEQRLLSLVRVSSVHVGTNFRFGFRGAGDVADLRRLGEDLGFSVVESPLLLEGGARVSSTRIRALLAAPGLLPQANELLGRCHFVRGVVEHGRGEGTSFGFPTANVRCAPRSCMPAEGVYGGYVTLGGLAWPAAINVGAPPTFSDPDELFLEANLIGFSGDAYGREVRVTFVEWLRASRPFKSTADLERVVLGNIEWVRTNLGSGEVEVALDH